MTEERLYIYIYIYIYMYVYIRLYYIYIISLSLSMIEHCLAKKELNNSAFSLKFVTNLSLWKTGGIQGIFLLLWKDFSTDQYVLGLVDGFINFMDKQE